MGGSGALRPAKLAKYLPDFGWNPLIVAARNPDWYYAYDTALLEELPDEIEITRTFMLRCAWIHRLLNPLRIRKMDKLLSRFLIQPDDQIGWIPFAYSSGLDIVRRGSVKAIYSTSAPLSCHLIAYLIHRKTQIPWVADFRDEWFENPDFSFPTSLHRRFHYHLEERIVKTAHKVIAPAPEFCRLLTKHGGDDNKFVTIQMGFDAADFSDPSVSRADRKSEFVISFSGLFYRSFRPSNLVKALNELIDEGKVPPERIQVKFVGANTADDIHCKDPHSICEFTGFVSHKEAVEHLKNSDALLLLLSEERGKNVVPSKTFEYMASGNPILAVVPSDGEVADIIRKSKTGIVADFRDIEAIKAAYLQLYRQWEDQSSWVEPDLSEIAKYDQKGLTKKFALLLDEIALS